MKVINKMTTKGEKIKEIELLIEDNQITDSYDGIRDVAITDNEKLAENFLDWHNRLMREREKKIMKKVSRNKLGVYLGHRGPVKDDVIIVEDLKAILDEGKGEE